MILFSPASIDAASESRFPTAKGKKKALQKECFFLWRRERDSNPWTANAVNGFRDRPVRPLRHLSIFNIYYNSFRFAKIHFIFHIQKFIFVFFFYYGLKNCFSVQFLNIFFLPLFHFSSFFAPKKHYSIRNLTQKKVEKIVVFSTFSHMLFLM